MALFGISHIANLLGPANKLRTAEDCTRLHRRDHRRIESWMRLAADSAQVASATPDVMEVLESQSPAAFSADHVMRLAERREQDRRQLGCRVEVRVVGPERMLPPVDSTLRDVSRDGFCFTTSLPCEIGDHVSLLICPPAGAENETPVTVLGTVRWCEERVSGEYTVGGNVGLNWASSMASVMFPKELQRRKSA